MEKSLDRLKVGEWGTVADICIDQDLERRLQDFGLVRGTRICCRYCSPHKDVTALELRGTVLALRTRDLAGIRVVGL